MTDAPTELGPDTPPEPFVNEVSGESEEVEVSKNQEPEADVDGNEVA